MDVLISAEQIRRRLDELAVGDVEGVEDLGGEDRRVPQVGLADLRRVLHLDPRLGTSRPRSVCQRAVRRPNASARLAATFAF